MAESNKTLFRVVITDEGYVFRNAILILKQEIRQATIIFTPKGFSISVLNTEQYAYHDFQFNTANMIYHYGVLDAQGAQTPHYCVAFNTVELYNAIGVIGKSDGLGLCQYEGENFMRITHLDTEHKGRNEASTFVTLKVTQGEILNDLPTFKDLPNLCILNGQFGKLCRKAATNKCFSVSIVGKGHTVYFKGVLKDNTLKFVVPYDDVHGERALEALEDKMGETTLEDLEEYTIVVPIATIKAISKIGNIAPKGKNLKIFFSCINDTKVLGDKTEVVKIPMVKFGCPMGSIGSYTLYLRSPS